MNEYSSPADLKGLARERLKGNYGVTVRAYIWMNITLVCVSWLSMSIFSESFGSHVFSVIIYGLCVILSGIFYAGCAFLYLNMANGSQIYPGMIFYNFRVLTDRAVLISLYIGALELGVSLMFIISWYVFLATRDAVCFLPMGIGAIIMIGGYLLIHVIYLPAYFMIHDFPEYKASDIIKICPNITRPAIARIIKLYLGIIPLRLLELLSLGVGAPWAESYVYAIYTEYYIDLMNPGRNTKTKVQTNEADVMKTGEADIT